MTTTTTSGRRPAWAQRRWTVEEFTDPRNEALLPERCELVEGEVWEVMPGGDRHTRAILLLTMAFAPCGPLGLVLSVQNGLLLDEISQPEPDLALLRLPDGPTGVPDGEQAVLAVEVAVTSVRRDRDRKMPLYAEKGLPEFWLVDLPAGVLERYRRPRGRNLSSRVRHDRVSGSV